jgi:hypothetical protein
MYLCLPLTGTPLRRPLLNNSSLDTFQQQRIGLWKLKRCYGINTRFRSNVEARNSRGNVGGSNLYSVHPELIKGGT